MGHLLPDNPNTALVFDRNRLKEIYFAGGCFWGTEAYIARVPGVCETEVGYANGVTADPTYEDVCTDTTGYAETVHVRYDPGRISLNRLAEQFFKIIDPTSLNRQGGDTGTQYRTGIYYTDPADRAVLEQGFRREQFDYKSPIVTELLPLENFYPAEEYHQDYLEKNPNGYCHVRFDSLRDFADCDPDRYARPDDAKLRADLSPMQYEATQQAATETAFTGAYWDHFERGLYIDIVTGQPLFSSADKFESGCGWPSFAKPVEQESVTERDDHSYNRYRVEVRSSGGDSHLGHVFEDGPEQLGGLRYCINSAALRFIPYDKLEESGYGAYKNQV